MAKFLKNSSKMQLFVVIAASVVFWIVAHQGVGVREAWDSENFLWAYLLAIALTSFFGALFDQNYEASRVFRRLLYVRRSYNEQHKFTVTVH